MKEAVFVGYYFMEWWKMWIPEESKYVIRVQRDVKLMNYLNHAYLKSFECDDIQDYCIICMISKFGFRGCCRGLISKFRVNVQITS